MFLRSRIEGRSWNQPALVKPPASLMMWANMEFINKLTVQVFSPTAGVGSVTLSHNWVTAFHTSDSLEGKTISPAQESLAEYGEILAHCTRGSSTGPSWGCVRGKGYTGLNFLGSRDGDRVETFNYPNPCFGIPCTFSFYFLWTQITPCTDRSHGRRPGLKPGPRQRKDN